MANIKKTVNKDLQIFRGTYEECMAQPTVNMQFYLAWDTQQLFVGNEKGGKTPYTGSSRAQIQKYLDTLRENLDASIQGKINTKVSEAVLSVADQIETILRADFEEELLDLKEGLDNANRSLNTIDTKVNRIDGDLTVVTNDKNELQDQVAAINDDLTEIIEETIPAITETIDTVVDTKLTAVEARLDTINDTLDEAGNARFENVNTEDITTGDPEYYYNLEGDSSLGETFYKDKSGHIYTIDKTSETIIIDPAVETEFAFTGNNNTSIGNKNFIAGFDPNKDWFKAYAGGGNGTTKYKVITDPEANVIKHNKFTFPLNGVNFNFEGEKSFLGIAGTVYFYSLITPSVEDYNTVNVQDDLINNNKSVILKCYPFVSKVIDPETSQPVVDENDEYVYHSEDSIKVTVKTVVRTIKEIKEQDGVNNEAALSRLQDPSNLIENVYTFSLVNNPTLPWTIEVNPLRLYSIESEYDDNEGKYKSFMISSWGIIGENNVQEINHYNWNGLVKPEDISAVGLSGKFEDLEDIPDFGDVIIKRQSEDIYPNIEDINTKLIKNDNGLFESTLNHEDGVLWNFMKLTGDPGVTRNVAYLTTAFRPYTDEFYPSLYSIQNYGEGSIYSLTPFGGIKLGGSNSGSGLRFAIYDNLEATKIRLKVAPYYTATKVDDEEIYVDINDKQYIIKANTYEGVKYANDTFAELSENVIGYIATTLNISYSVVEDFVRSYETEYGVNGDIYLALSKKFLKFAEKINVDTFIEMTSSMGDLPETDFELNDLTFKFDEEKINNDSSNWDGTYAWYMDFNVENYPDGGYYKLIMNIDGGNFLYLGADNDGRLYIYDDGSFEDVGSITITNANELQEYEVEQVKDFLRRTAVVKVPVFGKTYYAESKTYTIEAEIQKDENDHSYFTIQGSRRFILFGVEILAEGYKGLLQWVKLGTGGSDSSTPSTELLPTIEITYNELKTLRDSGKLVPGQKYQITNYECTTSTADTVAMKHQFDIIVTAVTNDKLSEDAEAAYHFVDPEAGEVFSCPNGGFMDGITLNDIHIMYTIREDEMETSYDDAKDNAHITEMTYLDGIPALFNPAPDGDTSHDVWLRYYGQQEIDGELYDLWLGDDSRDAHDDMESYYYFQASNVVVDPNKKTYTVGGSDFDDGADGYFRIHELQNIPAKTLESVYEEWENTGDIEVDRSKLAIRVESTHGNIDDYSGEWIDDTDFIDYIASPGTGLTLYKDGTDCGYLFKNLLYEEGCDPMWKYIYNGDVTENGVLYNKWLCYRRQSNYSGTFNATGNYILTNVVVRNGQFTVTQDDVINGIKAAFGVSDTGGTIEINETRANIPAWKLKYCLDNDQSRFAWAIKDQEPALVIKNTDDNGGSGYFYKRYPQADQGDWMAFVFINTNSWDGDATFDVVTDLNDIDTSNILLYDDLAVGTYDQDDNYSIMDVKEVTIAPTGRGVIYYMKDEWNNEAFYDFKNITFSDGTFNTYTFNRTGDSNDTYDISLNTDEYICKNNIIKPRYNDKQLVLNTVTFDSARTGSATYKDNYINENSYNIYFSGTHAIGNVVGKNCYTLLLKYSDYNTFDDRCHNNTVTGSYNTFGKECSVISMTSSSESKYNQFKDYCNNITFGTGCQYNIIGENDKYITLDNNCRYNVFETGILPESNSKRIYLYTASTKNKVAAGCQGITLLANTTGNTIGANCQNIIISADSSNNNIGAGCGDITIGTYSYGINVGEGCLSIIFKNLSNTYVQRARHITFLPGCKYLRIYNNSASYQDIPNGQWHGYDRIEYFIQNLVFHPGEYGTSNESYELVPSRTSASLPGSSIDYYKSDSQEVYL